MSQGPETTASAIINTLTRRAELPIFSCGEYNEDIALARSLVRMGTAAATDLGLVLDSLAERGERSEYAPNAGLLLLVYTRLKRKEAYGLLETMRERQDHSVQTVPGLLQPCTVEYTNG